LPRWFLFALAVLFVGLGLRYALKASNDGGAFNRW
jgi:hypothetical protein